MKYDAKTLRIWGYEIESEHETEAEAINYAEILLYSGSNRCIVTRAGGRSGWRVWMETDEAEEKRALAAD